MKIGIIGIRGIPNQYGGFEQFTEYAAPELVARGHEVYVYNSSFHPYKESSWRGVNIISQFNPENKIGPIGQFVYDLSCILDTRKRQYDVILQLGYTSSSIWSFVYPRNSKLVTNMDGLEWKRAKYSKLVQTFLKKAERWAALYSDALIADSKGIQEYLQNKYKKSSEFIPYGASIFDHPVEKVIENFKLAKYEYHMLVARLEPENNLEIIIKGHIQATRKSPLIIIGNHSTGYGNYLKKMYQNPYILFLGPLYNLEALNNLRYFSKLYFHGHSVGGTNPSLLEAMASNSLIVAHDNIFNKSILESDAFYFTTEQQISDLIDSNIRKGAFTNYLENNKRKIEILYSWKHIISLLENYLLNVSKFAKK